MVLYIVLVFTSVKEGHLCLEVIKLVFDHLVLFLELLSFHPHFAVAVSCGKKNKCYMYITNIIEESVSWE